jgi:hypothetical protein
MSGPVRDGPTTLPAVLSALGPGGRRAARHDWPAALSSGGCERGRCGWTLADMSIMHAVEKVRASVMSLVEDFAAKAVQGVGVRGVLAALGLIPTAEVDVAPAMVPVGGHRPSTAADRLGGHHRCGRIDP